MLEKPKKMFQKVLLLITTTTLFMTCQCQDTTNRLPPKILSIFDAEYYFPKNSDLTGKNSVKKCNAINGNIIYTWKKDGQKVSNSREVAVNATSGTIAFNRLQYGDYGMYQCFASNDMGTAVSYPFTLKESDIGSFSDQSTEVKACKQYEHCQVKCRSKPGCAPASKCRVEWKLGEGAKDNVKVGKRIAVDSNGDLHFLWVDTKDWTGKNYGCGVWNEQLNTLVKGSFYELKIEPVSSIAGSDPVIRHKKGGTARRGSDATLMCVFSGYPVPDVEWLTPALTTIKNTSKYSIEDWGRKLIIRRVTQDDEGLYTCTGKSVSKSSRQSVYLNVTSAPFLNPESKTQMNDVYQSTGKNASFLCDAISMKDESDPTPPEWMRNGAPLDVNLIGKKYLISDDQKMLTVIDAQKGDSVNTGDSGSFQCKSSNSEGLLFKDAILNVLDPIKIFHKPEGRYKIMPGDILRLYIDATTDTSMLPSFNIRWKYGDDGQIVSTKLPYWRLENNNRNLTIDVTDGGDLSKVVGKYEIEVYHLYDSEFVEFEMYTEMLTTAAPVVVPVQEANLFYIYIIVGVIFLIIVLIIVICLVRRNQGGVYSVDKKEVAAGHDPEKELLESGFHDLSRADDDRNNSNYTPYDYDDEKHIIDDDDDSLGEYEGDLELNKFNEDGSFIGLYADKKDKKPPKSESDV